MYFVQYIYPRNNLWLLRVSIHSLNALLSSIEECSQFLSLVLSDSSCIIMVAMVTMGGDLQPGCLADHDRLLTGLGQPQINTQAQKEKEKVYCSAEKGNHEQVGC